LKNLRNSYWCVGGGVGGGGGGGGGGVIVVYINLHQTVLPLIKNSIFGESYQGAITSIYSDYLSVLNELNKKELVNVITYYYITFIHISIS
jgi:hypothetical protein